MCVVTQKKIPVSHHPCVAASSRTNDNPPRESPDLTRDPRPPSTHRTSSWTPRTSPTCSRSPRPSGCAPPASYVSHPPPDELPPSGNPLPRTQRNLFLGTRSARTTLIQSGPLPLPLPPRRLDSRHPQRRAEGAPHRGGVSPRVRLRDPGGLPLVQARRLVPGVHPTRVHEAHGGDVHVRRHRRGKRPEPVQERSRRVFRGLQGDERGRQGAGGDQLPREEGQGEGQATPSRSRRLCAPPSRACKPCSGRI